MRKIKLNLLLPVIYAAIMLSPHFKLTAALPSFRFEDFIILGFFILKLVSGIKRTGLKSRNNQINKIFLLLVFSITISILVTELIHGIPIIMRDFFVIPQLIKYWLIFILVKSINFDSRVSKQLAYGIMITGAAMAAISFCQYFNLLGVNNWLTPIYEDEEWKLTALTQGHAWRRVVGTSVNSNYYGYLLVCTIACISSFLVHRKEKVLNGGFWLILCFIVISSVFTLSRTTIAILVLTFCLLIYFIFKYQKSKKTNTLKILIAIVIASFLFLSFFRTEGFDRRMSLNNLKSHGSLDARIRDLMNPFSKSLDSVALIMLGQGPSKSVLRTDSHNGYGWFYQRFGIVGLSLYISLIICPLKRAIRLYKLSEIWWQKFLSFASILVIANLAITEMGQDIFKLPQVMSLSVLFIAIPYASWSDRLIDNRYNYFNARVYSRYGSVSHYTSV